MITKIVREIKMQSHKKDHQGKGLEINEEINNMQRRIQELEEASSKKDQEISELLSKISLI